MLTVLVLLIGPMTILVVLLLVIVVIGIRQEPPTEELSEQAPSLTTVFVRRLLGVYVRKPDSPSNLDHGDQDHASPRPTLLAGPMRSFQPELAGQMAGMGRLGCTHAGGSGWA
jgi:hypothetical protein